MWKRSCNRNHENENAAKKVKEDDSVNNCRLRKLNADCLIAVFQLLNGNDLISMCKVDEFFKNLINDEVIQKRIINLSEMSNCCTVETFEIFGKSIRYLIISEYDLKICLSRIVDYCEPGRLIEMVLNFITSELNADIITTSMSYLKNLCKLSLRGVSKLDVSFDNLLIELAENASSLQTLHLSYIDVEGNWLITRKMQSLRELRIHKANYVSFVELNIFLRNHSKLTTLSFIGKHGVGRISDTLTNCGIDLDTFVDVQIDREPHLQDITNRYMFLSAFTNLKNVTLTSYTDCGVDLYHPLVQLARLNVTYLKLVLDSVTWNYNKPERELIMRQPFPECKSLQELEISNRNHTFESEFIVYFASQLTKLQKILFYGIDTTLDDISKLLELSPSINSMSIAKCFLKHLPAEIRKIVRSLRIRHINHPKNDQNMLRLIVNDEYQLREFSVYYDIDDIATLVPIASTRLDNDLYLYIS